MTHGDHGSAADSTSIFSSGLVGVEPTQSAEQREFPDPELAQAGSLPAGGALVVVKRGPNAGARFALDAEVVTAGRHPDSDIFLDDVSVSRRHAEFRRGEDGFDVVDVGSLNGTYVNRETVDSSPLTSGDEIQIGKFRLVYLRADVGNGPGSAGSTATS